MSITRRKLAPYAKQFLQTDPELPLAFLYFGPNAWSAKDQLNSRSIILPPHELSEHYDWRLLKNQWVIAYALGHTELAYRKRLAYELLLAGAELIHVFLPEQLEKVSLGGDAVEFMELVRPHERYRQ